ncbi:MAG: Fe2+-dependent dioxygenase [Comamonas sp.]
MFLHLRSILTPEELSGIRTALAEQAVWNDGARSAGQQAQTQKHNQQLAQDTPLSRQLQALVVNAVQRDPVFFAAALPKRIYNPLFNRYGGESNHYGSHIDGAVLRSQSTQQWVRTDISCTLFLSEPDEYDGGELEIQEGLAPQRVKLAAGDLVLYPGTTVHQVRPVTRGTRLASFFWVESMVRSLEQRRLLFDMDQHLVQLRQTLGEADPSVLALVGTYHNLLRMWADC